MARKAYIGEIACGVCDQGLRPLERSLFAEWILLWASVAASRHAIGVGTGWRSDLHQVTFSGPKNTPAHGTREEITGVGGAGGQGSDLSKFPLQAGVAHVVFFEWTISRDTNTK